MEFNNNGWQLSVKLESTTSSSIVSVQSISGFQQMLMQAQVVDTGLPFSSQGPLEQDKVL